MKRKARFIVSGLLAGLVVAGTASVSAQQKGDSAKQLVGTWLLSSIETTFPDGKKMQPFGPNAQGILVFDPSGRYTLQVCRPGRAKFASNNRSKGTPEENQATVDGCNPHWGKYSVDGKAITFHVEYAMFPNWEGIQQKRDFMLSGDRFSYSVPAASAGGTAEVVWTRAK